MKSLETSPRSGSSLLSALTKQFLRRTRSGFAVAAVAVAATGNSAWAASGTWITPTTGGFWSDTFNWSGDVVADGADSTANFATLDLTANNTVTFDLPRTIGNLVFGDTTPNFNWTLGDTAASVNLLTLQTTVGSAPTITVNNQTATIQAPVAGTQGFIKNGAGNLQITTNASTWTGNAVINAGTLGTNVAQSATAGFVLNNGATLQTTNILANTNFVNANTGSSTLNLATALGGGTGLGTWNGSFGGNGVITWTNSNASMTTLSTATILANFGGTLTWGSNFSIRAVQGTGGGTLSAPFATIDFANTTGNIYSRNAAVHVLGGLAGTNTGSSLGNSSNGGATNVIVGSANGNTTFTGSLLQGGASNPTFTKVGTGTLTVNPTAAWSSTGALGINGGTLLADYTNATAGVLNGASGIGFGGGTLLLLGKNTGVTAQTLGALTVSGPGGGRLIVNPNGGTSTTLTLGTITSTAVGGTLNIQPPDATIGAGSAIVTTTTAPSVDGTYGARLTYGKDWASSASGVSPYQLSAYAGYSVFTGTGDNGASNYLLTDSGVMTAADTANSLKIDTTTAGGVLNMGGFGLTLTNGGLLFAGANDYTIGATVGDNLKSAVAGNSALTVHQLGTGALTIAAVIANGNGAQTFTKTGSGLVVLSGVNTYTGQTYVNGGLLSVSANDNLGAGVTGAALNLNGGGLQATSTMALDNAGLNLRNVTIGGGGGTFDVTGANTLTVSGVISNLAANQFGPLIKTGSGTLALAGTNTYTGATILRGGVLSVGALPNGGTAGPLGNSAGVAPALVLDGGTLRYTGATASSNRTFTLSSNGGGIDASGSGALTLSSTLSEAYSGAGNRTLTLTGTNTDANTLAAPIGDASTSTGSTGTVGITKTGTGKWVLSNLTNSYTGSTTVSGGTLALSASTTNNIASSSSIIVGSGATLDVTGLTNGKIVLGGAQALAGDGTISGGVTTAAGSTVSPGVSGIGTLTTGAFTINTGTTFNFEFPTSGANDLISATDLTLAALTGGLSGGGFNLYQVGTLNKFTQTGTFNLFGYSGSLVGDPTTLFTSASILNPQAGLNYNFNLNGGFIRLTITGSAALVGQWTATSNGNWSNGANWSTNPLFPTTAGTTANFTTAQTSLRTVTLDGSRTVGTIAFDSSVGGYVIANGVGTLTLDNAGSPAVVSVANGSHSITAPVALNSNVGIAVDHASDVLAISGNISNSSTAKTITKSGPGKLILSGSNTYGGTAGTVSTTLAAGTLGIGSSSALGAGDLAVTANAKVTAEADALTVPNNVVVTGGAIATVDTQGNTFTLAGIVSETGGTAALTKSGNGTLKLTGTNTFTGATTINSGTLQLGNGGTTGSVAGTIVNNGALVLSRSDDYTFSNVVSGTGSLTKLGTNNITIDGTNTFTGNTVLSGGTLTLNNALALQGSTVNYNGQGGTLSFGALTAATLGGLTGSQNLSLLNSGLGAVTLSIGANNQSTTYSGVFDGAGANVTKVGSGVLTLTGVRTYTGTTGASTGVLSIGATGVINGTAIFTSANLGGQFRIDGGSVTTSALSTINSGSSFLMNSGSATFNAGLRIASTGSDGNLVQVNGGTLTTTDITIQRSQTYTVAPTAVAPIAAGTGNGLYLNGASAVVNVGTMTIGTTNSSAGSRIDAGALNVTGQFTVGRTTNGGRWNIFQVNGGTFTSTDTTNGVVIAPNNGATANLAEFYVSAGTATAERIAFGAVADTVGGTGWLIVGGGNLYVGSQGIVQDNITGLYSSNIALLSGQLGASANWSTTLPMQLSGTNLTSFTIKAADAADVARNITLLGAVSGTGNLIKTGAGTLNLSGVNTYTGNTTVSAGGLTLGLGGQLAFTIGANGVNNKISGSGVLTLDGAFNFNLTGASTTEGNLWNIVDVASISETYSPTFSVAGFSAQPGDVWELNDSVNLWTFSEATGNLSVAAVPEPGTIALLVGGAGMLVLVRRRRK